MEKAESGPRAALVTGAAGGIGAAVVQRLQRDGWRVAGIDLEPAVNADLQARTDVRDGPALASAIEQLQRQAGDFHALVHCAAICPPGTVLGSDPSMFADTYAANVISAVRLIQACVPGMRAHGGGSIVLLSSINARFATPSLAAYASSKAALEELTRSAALELAVDDIRVNAVAPASIDTPMLQASFAREDDPVQARERNVARHPLGRLGTVDDVAELVLFLATQRSAWITGGVFPVDGGASITRR